MAGKGSKKRPTDETKYQTNHRRYHATTKELEQELKGKLNGDLPQIRQVASYRGTLLQALKKCDEESSDA